MVDKNEKPNAYRICGSGELTECFHSILGAYLHRDACSGAQFSHHHWIFLHDTLVDLQEFLGIRLVQRAHQHRGNLKAALLDFPNDVAGDTCSRMCTP